VAEGGGAAELVDLGQAFLKGLWGVVEELQLVGGSGWSPSGLAPLSETTMISVLSSSPVSFKKSSRRPM
jgi:hypothetical protein